MRRSQVGGCHWQRSTGDADVSGLSLRQAMIRAGSVSDGQSLPSLTLLALSGRNDSIGKPLHLFQLRTALKQQQIDARLLKCSHLIEDLWRCAHQPGSQAAIGNRIVLERYPLFELRAG